MGEHMRHYCELLHDNVIATFEQRVEALAKVMGGEGNEYCTSSDRV